MKLYHGSNADFDSISLTIGLRYKDFGWGFYATPDRKTAVRMAQKKARLFGGTPTLITYELDEAALQSDLKIKRFPETATVEWFLFVDTNRDRKNDKPIHDYDTLTVTDTLWLTEYLHDTIYLPQYIHDTITIHDTIIVGINNVETVNAKIYTSNGQIVVEGADGNNVWLYDINGRMLATKQDYGIPIRFDAPASGTYLIKIGNHPARKVVVIK